MKTRVLLTTLIVALVVPALALAHRSATTSEKTAMMYHAGSHDPPLTAKEVDAPAAYPLGCAVADITTVVKGSNWGGWAFNAKKFKSKQCAKWASNGWVLEHKIKGKWYVVTEGSELPSHIPGVPHKIAADVVAGLG